MGNKQEFLNMFWSCLKHGDIKILLESEFVDGRGHLYPVIHVSDGEGSYNKIEIIRNGITVVE